ncbi:MAG: hypothetical protein H6Q90_3274 [Deltaproteobacteria bacterium]|nr:hypothetical protein [Deltaproteobacteria bacterium]
MKPFLLLTVLALADAPAYAERGIHGTAGVGSSLVLTGDGGDRVRFDIVVDVKPRSRFGGLVAWRAFDDHHRGLVMAGVVYEGAAARPLLVLDLHAELGGDLDARVPLVGGGLRITAKIIGPLSVALDTAAYLVLDGIDDTRLQLQTNALLVGRW